MTTSQIRIRYGSRIAAWVLLAVAMSGTAKADYRQGAEAYKRSDYQRALSEVRPLAEIGDPHSQFLLGVLYSEGKGVTENDTLAYGWMKLAADAGIAQAITEEKRLGEILLPESRAAAHAALGEFTAAAADEQAAMQAAKSLKWNTADMEARFASYQGAQPWFGELIPM